MSVAFTREEDYEAAAAHLPDRPVSPHPNLVTAEGLAAIEQALADAKAAYAAAQAEGGVQADRTAMARATRDLRYWSARRGSAQLTPPDPSRTGVQFGDVIVIDRGDGVERRFRIVGEDEADPAAGSVSYASPLARAVMGREAGDEFALAGSTVELVGVDRPTERLATLPPC